MVSGLTYGPKMLVGLQLLRFSAALLVLVFHIALYAKWFKVIPGPPSDVPIMIGAAGVTLFFALSGFLMARLAETMPAGRFILHRIARIYPPFFAAVALIAMLQFILLGSATPFDPLILTLLPTGSSRSPLSVEWSLVYEVFFYGVIALLCLIRNRIILRGAVLGWATVLIIVKVVGLTASPMWPAGIEIVVSGQNLVFVAGMIAFWLRDLVRPFPALAAVGAVVGLHTAYPQNAALLETAFIIVPALLVLAFSAVKISVFRATINRAGDASYGIYLLHVPVLTLCYALLPGAGALTVAATFLIALCFGGTFGLIEHKGYLWMRERLDSFRLRFVMQPS